LAAMRKEPPRSWHIGAEAAGDQRLDLATQYAHFFWDDTYSERYTEEQLKQKIEAESRSGDDDPFVKAYRSLVDSVRSRRATTA
jgi:hypothetical protein